VAAQLSTCRKGLSSLELVNIVVQICEMIFLGRVFVSRAGKVTAHLIYA
jgi:hypothetical protein